MNEILAFTVIALLLVLSPGPNGVLILKTVSGKGAKAAVENILGLVLATFCHGAVSVLGLSALILQSAELFMLIKFIGAAYLLYLGLKTLIGSFRQQAHASPVAATPANNTPAHKVSQFNQNVLEGFLTQILNPKVSMFYLAAFPQFVVFGEAGYFDALVLVSIHAALIFSWFLGFSLFIVRAKRIGSEHWLSRWVGRWLGRWVQRLSGVLLVYFSVLLLTQEANHVQ